MAPIGTNGRIVVRDTTTGEELEQHFMWRWWGQSGMFARLWQAVKNAVWKG